MPTDYAERLAASCRTTCKRRHCTGTGSTHHLAHRCAFAPDVQLDPHPCAWCEQPGVHPFPAGWLCDTHAPGQPVPDPQLTAAALAQRELSAVFPSPCAYGAARG